MTLPFDRILGPNRFPDLAVVRHLHKRGLDRTPGAHVLELGCGNGVNLLPYAAGWACTGVDIEPTALRQAHHNLQGKGRLIEADLRTATLPEHQYDALIMAHVLCYLSDPQAERLMLQLKSRLTPGAHVFARTRSISDGRYGRGVPTGTDAFVLDSHETGEVGHHPRFHTSASICRLLAVAGIEVDHLLRERWDNPQGGQVTTNDDLVVWGRAG